MKNRYALLSVVAALALGACVEPIVRGAKPPPPDPNAPDDISGVYVRESPATILRVSRLGENWLIDFENQNGSAPKQKSDCLMAAGGSYRDGVMLASSVLYDGFEGELEDQWGSTFGNEFVLKFTSDAAKVMYSNDKFEKCSGLYIKK